MIKTIVVCENELAIKWSAGQDQFINLKKLRIACPCAGCSGETDAFGNVYANPKKTLVLDAFKIKKYEFVGLYGVRFFWADGHRDGIYVFDLLKSLSQ